MQDYLPVLKEIQKTAQHMEYLLCADVEAEACLNQMDNNATKLSDLQEKLFAMIDSDFSTLYVKDFLFNLETTNGKE